MPISKNIYADAKTYVRKNMIPVATAFPYELFVSYNKVELTSEGSKKSYKKGQALFNLTCLRLLMKNKIALTDPIEKEPEFRIIARTLRLNEFDKDGMDFDLGCGKGTSNNLVYKLASDYYTASEMAQFDAKPGLVAFALTDPDFLSNIADSPALDDRRTYECITKQAFYKWHYENFINTTALKDVLKKENAADGSIRVWSDVLTGPNLDPAIFISKGGTPFNTGVPVFCVVFEGPKDYKDEKNKYKVIAKAFDYLFPLVGRKKYSDLTTQQKAEVEKFILAKEFTHATTEVNHKPYRFKILETGDKIKICVGADYAQLVCGFNAIKAGGQALSPSQHYFDSIEYAIANLGQADDRYFLNKKSLVATNNKNTDIVFNEQVSSLVKILDKKDAAVQKGPALFFELDRAVEGKNVTLSWYSDLKADLEKYENIDDTDTTDTILKAQYSLSLKNVAATIKESYMPFIKQYKIQRVADPRLLNMNFDTSKVLEDIVFYYDQSYNLLAIGAAQNKTTKKQASEKEERLQRNNVPFEFWILKTPTEAGLLDVFKDEELNYPFSILDPYYSILPPPPDDSAGGIMNVGLAGPVLLVTEYFVNALYENYDKIPGSGNKLLDKDKVFALKSPDDPDEKNLLKENLPFFVSYKELETKVVGANEVFASLLLKTANRFFQSSNEIILGEDKGGTYSFLTKSLEVAGGIVDFFNEPTTFEDADLIVADNIQVFLDRFHYPELLIKPTVPKQKSAEVVEKEANTIKKNEGAPSTKKAEDEKVIDIDDYNASNKLFTKQVFIIAAQSSDSACLNELAEVVRTGSMTDIYVFLLTKFPIGQMLAKALLANLRRLSNLVDTKDSRNFADQVNACLKDLNVEKILAAFANFKSMFKNLDDILTASLPEIPKLDTMPYIYVLDYQKMARDEMFKAILEGVMSTLQVLLGVMLKDLLDACEQDGSLQTMLFNSSKGNLGKDGRNAKDSLADSVNTAAFTPVTDDEFGSKKVYVDLIAILKASRICNLENTLNGLLELFPILKSPANSNPLIALENFLDGLSSKVSAYDTKALLNGIASASTTNKVINFAATQPPSTLIPNAFNNKYSVLLMYRYLKKCINLDLINKRIVEVTTIVPDPCFINLGNIGTEDLQLLKDFLGDDEQRAYVAGLVNDGAAQLNSMCAKFANGIYNASVEMPNLISQSSKKVLQKTVDSSLEPIINFQKNAQRTTLSRAPKIASTLEQVYGLRALTGESADSQVAIVDIPHAAAKLTPADMGPYKTPTTLRKLRDIILFSIDFNILAKNDLKFFKKALSAKFQPGVATKESPSIMPTLNVRLSESVLATFEQTLPGEEPGFKFLGRKDFFVFLYGSLLAQLPDMPDAAQLLEDQLKALESAKEIEKYFEKRKFFKSPKEIKDAANKKFNEVIDEGGKNTNFYVANLKEMKRIIKSLKPPGTPTVAGTEKTAPAGKDKDVEAHVGTTEELEKKGYE